MFTGLSQDEAKDIVGEIQDKGTKYLYDASTGTIQVPQEDADKLRAEMLSEGYPKSGFTYSMYVSNSNIMANTDTPTITKDPSVVPILPASSIFLHTEGRSKLLIMITR